MYVLKKNINNGETNELPKELNEWMNENKSKIVPNIFEKSIAYDSKVYPNKYIIYSFNMNKDYETYNQQIKEAINILQNKGDHINISIKKDKIKEEIDILNTKMIKLFQPISTRKSNIPKYINIDTATLMNLFSEKGEKAKKLKTLKENQNKMWYKIFNMDHKIFTQSKDYIFNYTLQTDGIGVSLLFRHISIKDQKYGHKRKKLIDEDTYVDDLTIDQLNILQNKKIVTCDPGKYNMAYMVDDDGNKLRYTCAQRDTESLAKKNRNIMKKNKILNKIVEIESKLSDVTSKTVNYDEFKRYIKKKHNINIQVKAFYEKEICRKLNWRAQTNRRKSEDKFLNNINKTFGDNIFICYGDYSRNTQMKYHVPTLGKGLRKIIEKKHNVILVNEFNTSKKCCNCWKDLINHIINGEEKHRLLVCKNLECMNIGSLESKPCPMFINRDLNACNNMMMIVKNIIYGHKRPKEFCKDNDN